MICLYTADYCASVALQTAVKRSLPLLACPEESASSLDATAKPDRKAGPSIYTSIPRLFSATEPKSCLHEQNDARKSERFTDVLMQRDGLIGSMPCCVLAIRIRALAVLRVCVLTFTPRRGNKLPA